MKYVAWAVVIAAVLAAAYFYFSHGSAAPQTAEPSAPIASATYSCDNGHTIHADYYEGTKAPQPVPGQPPTPTGSVNVALDGGEAMTLKQTISADGARYSDGNPQISQGQSGAESFVFWNKGNTALIMRNNQMDLTYTNCAQK